MEIKDLRAYQAMPLDSKINMTISVIRSYIDFCGTYDRANKGVYLAFSGGLDSTVLKQIIDNNIGGIPSVFVNTGLEFPEIQKFVKDIQNGKYSNFSSDVKIVYPKMRFDEVIKKHGYPVGSKKIARMIRDLQNPTERNKRTRELYLTGLKKDGSLSKSFKLSKRFIPVIDSDIKVSEKCCDIIKKEPLKRYEKVTGRNPIVATMACESRLREIAYLKTGCNIFTDKTCRSMPMSFWTEQDVLQYIKEFNVPYCSVYGDIIEKNGKLITTGEKRTGCMYCMFGVHLEKEPNRFQRMKETHPKQYKYCMEKLEVKKVLDFLKISG